MSESYYTLAVIVENESGILAKISGMFAARNFNITSLTVRNIDKAAKISRISIVTFADADRISQIVKQLQRLVPIREVVNLSTGDEDFVEKELCLIKIQTSGVQRRESLRLADIFKAEVTDTTLTSFIFMVHGSSKKIGAFIDLLEDLGEVEVARSGVVAMTRGSKILKIG